MLEFFKKKEKVNPYPNYTQEELDTVFPMTNIVVVDSVGIFDYNGNEIAYNHQDYALLDRIIDPTAVIVLTNKSGEQLPEPALLEKTNAATVLPTYAFMSNGKMFAFRDNIPVRKKNILSMSVKELIDKSRLKNKLAQEKAVEEFNRREQNKHDQDFIDSMFSK